LDLPKIFLYIPNEWSKKKFQESNIWGSFVKKTQKEHVYLPFVMLIVFRRV
jgi:hypothetical protein